MKYRQCELQKDKVRIVSWLPEKYAKENSIVGLKDNGVWAEGWRVLSSSSFSVDEKFALRRRDDYRNQRSVSDI